MVKIIIKDLEMSKELDKKAMSEIMGGRRSGYGFQTSAWKIDRRAWLTQPPNKKRPAQWS